MQKLLGQEYPLYQQSFNNKRLYGLRVNTSKISVEEFLKISPFDLKPIPWTDDGFYYQESDNPAKHPYYYTGLYYLQEPSAMLPGQVLPIEEGDKVLDCCAAPGGKSTKLAVKLNNTGLLFSNDISASRCKGLVKNLELFGLRNFVVSAEDTTKLADKYPEYFDKILIDAPCSGEGMFRKDSSLINQWNQDSNEYYASLQKQIVSAALKMLKQGGMLVYSTCTFSEKENEDTIRYMMDICEDLHLCDIKMCDGFKPGLNEIDKAVRLYPHHIDGEGHFVCLLQKGEAVTKEESEEVDHHLTVDEEARNFLMKINGLDEKGLVLKNDKLYWFNSDIDTQGIRILRNGLLIGTYKNYRFEPSGVLALSLNKNNFDNVLDLPSDDTRVMKYLKGETLSVDEELKDGYVLVCVDGFGLGFGKYNNHQLKNKYEKGWVLQ